MNKEGTEPAREAEVMSCVKVCKTFPRLPEHEVSRVNLLQAIETEFENGFDLVGIDGQDGIGKTVLLAQFARRHTNRCFSVFIKPTSRFAYDPNFLRADLCDQMSLVLSPRDWVPSGPGDLSACRQLFLDLQRRARSSPHAFYFIVDGLEEIPAGGTEVREIIDTLPLGLPQFGFLISGKAEELLGEKRRSVPCRSFPIPGFSPDETKHLFSSLPISNDRVEEYHRAYKGIPGRLAGVARLLESGTCIDAPSGQLPAPDPFEAEWRKLNTDDKVAMEALTFLAWERGSHTVSSIAAVLGCTPDDVRKAFSTLTFIWTPSTDNERVEYISEVYRKFAAEKLRSRRAPVREKFINALLQDPLSEEALTLLPSHLEETGRLDKLLEFLSPAHFVAMIESSQSLSAASQKAEMGLSAALNLGRDGDLLRFGLQKAVVSDLDACEISRAEIQARMALGDYKSAVSLAQSSVLKQDRLRLLAIIARHQRETGLALETELKQQIDQLFEETDLSSLGERLPELASDLMFSNPERAIQLAEQAPSATTEGPAGTVDWALAHLSVAATASKSLSGTGVSERAEEIRSRIRDPALLQATIAVSIQLGTYTARDILREVAKLQRPQDKLFLLRQWCLHVEEPEGVTEVLELALPLTVKTTEYTPHAKDLRQFAAALALVPDHGRLRSLVEAFDGLKGSAEKLGPSEDYVRLTLRLTHAECAYDRRAANRRLGEAFNYTARIEDAEVRAACLARIVAGVHEIDPDFSMEDSEVILRTAEDDLRKSLEKLLKSTAEHYLVTRAVVKALASRRPELAFEVSQSLNTEPRRDASLLDIFAHSIKQHPEKIPLGYLWDMLGKFSNPRTKDEAVDKLLEKLASVAEKSRPSPLSDLMPFVASVEKISDAKARCKASSNLLSVVSSAPGRPLADLEAHLEKVLRNAWEGISDRRAKAEEAFRIAAALASYHREESAEYVRLAEALREGTGGDFVLPSFVPCVRLAIRAYSGLLPSNLATDNDLKEMEVLIQRVPSDLSKIFLWTDLAARCLLADRFQTSRGIVSQQIRPLLQDIRKRNPDDWQFALTLAAPALYRANSPSAHELLEHLPPSQRDDAYDAVMAFILRGVSPFDPYEAATYRSSLSYEDVAEACDILARFDEDAEIYRWTIRIVETTLWKKNGFSQEQKTDIAQKINKTAISNLPNPRFIAHDGFRILCVAQASRLLKHNPDKWEQLAQEGRQIPNTSDRAFVLAEIAEMAHGSDRRKAIDMLSEAKTLTDGIPAVLDRVESYAHIAECAMDVDKDASKKLIRDAIANLPANQDPETDSSRREIVDLAHRIDPELAASIAASLDDDEARKLARERIALQELKKKLAEGKLGESSDKQSRKELPQAAWSLLGRLNANRIETLSVGDTRDVLKEASTYPLRKAFPIMSWVVENAIRRRGAAGESAKLLRSILMATSVGSELSLLLGRRDSRRLRDILPKEPFTSDRQGIIVRSGERKKALEYLQDWLSNNAAEYLKICDPYFGPDDLEVLQLVLRASRTLHVSVLTSRRHQSLQNVGPSPEEKYTEKWKEISDQDPPDTYIVVVGNPRGELPIHERWWLTRGAGLRLGTSFNGLGDKKDSEILTLSADEAAEREILVDEYVEVRKKVHDGEKLSIQAFPL